MGIFSNLFKNKPKVKVITDIGEFALVYSKDNKNLWSNGDLEIHSTVRGTNKNPNAEQIEFLKTSDKEIDKLSQKITEKFLKELSDADLASDFKSWEERFIIVGIEVMMFFENDAYWNITFEDKEEPFAHFTIFIEGDKINSDFAIDT